MRIELLLILPLLMASGYREAPDDPSSSSSAESSSYSASLSTSKAYGGDGGEATSSASGGTATNSTTNNQSLISISGVSADDEDDPGGGSSISSANGSTGDILSPSTEVTTNIQTGHQGKTRRIKNTPDPYAPPIYPTVPCFKGGSGSATGPGWGISVGGGKIDPECNEREWIRMGPTVAHRVHTYCSSDFAMERFESFEDCVGQAPDPLPEVVRTAGGSLSIELAQVSQQEAQDIRYEQREQQQVQQQQVQLLDRLERRLQEAEARDKERARQDADFRRGVKKISEYGDDVE